MNPNLLPNPYNFWYVKYNTNASLTKSIKTNVVVVGGGMAGLSAAQAFHNKGFSVVLVEKNYCGAGASGKSSGFITPDAELSLTDLSVIYGNMAAKNLWKFSTAGVQLIKNNIEDFNIDCDYQVQDTLILANTKSTFKSKIKEEYDHRKSLGYDARLYSEDDVKNIVNSSKYKGGISYPETFGIQPYEYCQAMKRILSEKGVLIFEDSPVTKVSSKGIETEFGSVSADYIILCMDRFLPNLSALKKEVYHAQNLLLLSKVLSPEQVKAIFPDKKYMVWDTDLIYQYYRLSGDNRIMLGGSNFLSVYRTHANYNNTIMFNKLDKYFKYMFPQVNVEYEYMWPGMIGVSKDIMPIGGRDKDFPNIYYAGAATGLPWSAALGMYCADNLINNRDDLDSYFSPYRKFFINRLAQTFLGTKLSFAISNFMREKRLY